MDETAQGYNLQGLRLLNLGRYEEAISFFTKAIETDPDFTLAYKNRGETYILLERFVEGNTDIQRAKDLLSRRYRTKEKPKAAKLDISAVDNIYDSIFTDEGNGTDALPLEAEDNLYDSLFGDEAPDTELTWEVSPQEEPEAESYPAVIELIGGRHLNASGVTLFHPTGDTVSVELQDGGPTQIIPFEKIACLRMAGVPEPLSDRQKEASRMEIIETVDGTVYHELIHPEQDLDTVLFGFSTKTQSRFPYSLIPRMNIQARSLKSLLGEILLEKRFIANDILKNALDEFHHVKNMKIGRIIAQKAQILYTAVEEELEKARHNRITGLKAGEILLASGLVNEEQVLEALEYQEDMRNLRIGQFLVRKGIVQEREVYMSLAEQHRFPYIDLPAQKISKKVLTLLPRDLVVHHEILPVAYHDGTLVVAIHDVDTGNLCEQILKSTKCSRIQFGVTQPTHIKNIISRLYGASMVAH